MFDTVSPALTSKVDHVPEEPLQKKILKNMMLMGYWVICKGQKREPSPKLEPSMNEATYFSKSSEVDEIILSFSAPHLREFVFLDY